MRLLVNLLFKHLKLTLSDFWQAGIELSPEKVKYKLAQVKTKLSLEDKFKAGIERMLQVVTDQSPDNKNAVEIRKKLQDSCDRLQLLKKTQIKYRSLDISPSSDGAETDPNASSTSITGKSCATYSN